MSKKLIMIGYITRDYNVTLGNERNEPGGAVYHGAIAAACCTEKLAKRKLADSLGIEVVTKLNAGDEDLLTELKNLRIPVHIIYDKKTTEMKNIFSLENPDERESSAKQVSKPFELRDRFDVDDTTSTLEDFIDKNREAIFYIGSLVTAASNHYIPDIPYETLGRIKKNAKKILLEIQGYVRFGELGKNFRQEIPKNLSSLLDGVDYLKLDIEELRLLTGRKIDPTKDNDVKEALQKVARYTGKDTEILLTSKEGPMVYVANDGIYIGRWNNKSNKGRNGRGDISFLILLILQLLDQVPPQEAIQIVAEIVSRKMEHSGPIRESDFGIFRE